MQSLPIDAVLPALRAALSSRDEAVLEAPPGAGKTTRVPLALLDEPWLAGQSILMLEPRRLAARAAAERLASELGEAVGDTVGYRIRLDSKVGPNTRIEACNLTKELDIVVKLYSCSAGASTGGAAWGGSNTVFARSFANRLRNSHHYYNATIFGYTATVTSPSDEGELGVHRWAVSDHGGILGRASEYRSHFDGY